MKLFKIKKHCLPIGTICFAMGVAQRQIDSTIETASSIQENHAVPGTEQ